MAGIVQAREEESRFVDGLAYSQEPGMHDQPMKQRRISSE